MGGQEAGHTRLSEAFNSAWKSGLQEEGLSFNDVLTLASLKLTILFRIIQRSKIKF